VKTVAVVIGMFVLLFGVVVAARVAVFYFADPPTLEVTRLSLVETGKPVMASSDRGTNPSAGIAAFLRSPRQFVFQGYVQPGKNDGDKFSVTVLCFNERDATQFQDTFSDGEGDDRGGFTIGVEVTAYDADVCSISAMATPRTYIGDPSDTRRGFARVALYCPSGCETIEPERPND
jgi:hypothetical protein